MPPFLASAGGGNDSFASSSGKKQHTNLRDLKEMGTNLTAPKPAGPTEERKTVNYERSQRLSTVSLIDDPLLEQDLVEASSSVPDPKNAKKKVAQKTEAKRKTEEGISEEDMEWLETLLPGMQEDATGMPSVYNEDSFLTELIDPRDRKGLLLPFSRKRVMWDFLTLSLVVYTALVLPYILCFVSPTQSNPPWMVVIDVMADAIFVFDIFLNFNTAYVRSIDATLITDRRMIAQNYFAGWLAIDVAGSIPFEIISLIVSAATGGEKGLGGDAGSLGIVKALKAPKLLRLGRLFKFLTRFEGAANIGRIVVLIMLLCMLIHWLACGWFLIAGAPGGWVDKWLCGLLGDEVSHSLFEPNDPGGGAFECVPQTTEAMFGIYLYSYYSVLLMIMGDSVDPTTRGETAYVVMVVLIGSCVNATIFANVASLTAQITASSATHQAKMDSIDRAMRQLQLNNATRRQIRGYFNYKWTRHRDHAGEKFIESLPLPLRMRTSSMVHETMIRKCPLFRDAQGKLVAALSASLIAEVYLPMQFIVIAGYVSRSMYFLRRGRVQIIRKVEVTGEFLLQECHDYFDVVSLFSQRQHTLSVRSLTHTDLYKLRRAEFEAIIKEYPAQAGVIADAARKHLKPVHAAIAAKQMYELVGIPELLKRLQEHKRNKHWTKGLSKKIVDLHNKMTSDGYHELSQSARAHYLKTNGKKMASTRKSADSAIEEDSVHHFPGMPGFTAAKSASYSKTSGSFIADRKSSHANYGIDGRRSYHADWAAQQLAIAELLQRLSSQQEELLTAQRKAFDTISRQMLQLVEQQEASMTYIRAVQEKEREAEGAQSIEERLTSATMLQSGSRNSPLHSRRLAPLEV